MKTNNKLLTFTGAVAALVLIVAVLLGVAVILSSKTIAHEVGLPVLAICGVVLLLGTLSVVSIAFTLFGIEDKTQALGLPEGSIRAVIALTLVVLFGILSIYLYSNMASGGIAHVYDLTAQQAVSFRATLSPDQLISDVAEAGGSHTIYFRVRPDAASSDFAKQILTLLGTLVTAISSFYFGSKAATPPSTTPEPVASPTLTSILPTSAAAGTTTKLSVTGTNLSGVTGVRLRNGTYVVQGVNLIAHAGDLTVDMPVPAGSPKGPWDLVVTAGGSDKAMTGGVAVT